MTTVTLPAAPEQLQATQPVAGFATMVRFVVRRNRVLLVVWPLTIVGLFAFVAAYYRDMLNSQQALDAFAAVSNTASIKALTGLAAEPATLGGAVWTKIWMTDALMLAFACVFLVTRTGRADEEAGRTELLRSKALGLHAYSVATWAVVAAMCVVSGAGIALTSIVAGLDPAGTGITGSVIVGASVTGAGLVALGVSALAGQVTTSSRAANATASAVIGVMYMLRMLGDLSSGALTWASPIGWGEEMQPWGANRWWPLLLSVGLAAVVLAGALMLEARRDIGAGLLVTRPGPARAPVRFATPLGLALHLERGVIIGWTATVVLAAVMFGSVVPAMAELLSEPNGNFASVVGGQGVEALISLLVTMVSLIVTVFAVQTTLTLRQDEARGLLEVQLSGAVSRIRWAGQRLLIPAVGSAVLLVMAGCLIGVGYAAAGGGTAFIGPLMWAALAYWPAVMILTGVAVFLFGWLPHGSMGGTWAVLGLMWVLVVTGDALHLPTALVDATPFMATPRAPMEPMSWPPVLLLALVAVALVSAGLYRFVRRDIQAD